MSPADSPFAQLPAPGPHPATAKLRAYAADTLAPAEEHHIEAHLLDCERCADLVDGFSMSDDATTDQAVAELRARLQARLGTTEPEPVAAGWAWPRIAAAAALLGVVGSGIWAWEQHDTATLPATAHVETSQAPAPVVPAAPANTDLAATANKAEAPATETTRVPAKAAKPTDYAAAAPTRVARRMPVMPRRAIQVERADDGFVDHSAEATIESAAASSAPVLAEKTEAPAASQADMPSTAQGYSSAAPAATKRKEGLIAGRLGTADTAAISQDDAFGAPAAKKAKTMAPPTDGPPARVANTPMPAAPALSPSPVGGSIALREYLRREAAEFSPEINNVHLNGNVRVRFIVGADGKISELKVVRGLRADYDSEALRIVCDGPAWQPGVAGGKRAPLPMEVTVPF